MISLISRSMSSDWMPSISLINLSVNPLFLPEPCFLTYLSLSFKLLENISECSNFLSKIWIIFYEVFLCFINLKTTSQKVNVIYFVIMQNFDLPLEPYYFHQKAVWFFIFLSLFICFISLKNLTLFIFYKELL